MSKVTSAMEILREDGIIPLLRQSKAELFPNRDRYRELTGPAAEVYDCFIFYNELDVLHLRLNELDDIVDKFVLVEATETFQGESKRLHFENNKEQYKEFEDKIIHHVVEYPDRLKDPWEREYYLRDSIREALKYKSKISSEDEILISDADEIPCPESIERGIKEDGVKIFSQSIHYYYFNYILDGRARWLGPVMCKYRDFTTPQDFRNRYTQHREDPGRFPMKPYFLVLQLVLSLGNNTKVKILHDGGWHFSYLGDVDYMIDKIETFSHTELNKDEYKDPNRIAEAIAEGKDLFGQGLEFKPVSIDGSFPEYLQQNTEAFSSNIISIPEQ